MKLVCNTEMKQVAAVDLWVGGCCQSVLYGTPGIAVVGHKTCNQDFQEVAGAIPCASVIKQYNSVPV